MSCEFCRGIEVHDNRCPNYKPKMTNHFCSICNDGIFDGERYIERDCKCAHWDCFDGMKHLLEFLGYEIKTMKGDFE